MNLLSGSTFFLYFSPIPLYLSVLVCLLIFAWVFVITTEVLLVGILWGLEWMTFFFFFLFSPSRGFAFVSARCLAALLVWDHFNLNLPFKFFRPPRWCKELQFCTWGPACEYNLLETPPPSHSEWERGLFWFILIRRVWLLGASA